MKDPNSYFLPHGKGLYLPQTPDPEEAVSDVPEGKKQKCPKLKEL